MTIVTPGRAGTSSPITGCPGSSPATSSPPLGLRVGEQQQLVLADRAGRTGGDGPSPGSAGYPR